MYRFFKVIEVVEKKILFLSPKGNRIEVCKILGPDPDPNCFIIQIFYVAEDFRTFSGKTTLDFSLRQLAYL